MNPHSTNQGSQKTKIIFEKDFSGKNSQNKNKKFINKDDAHIWYYIICNCLKNILKVLNQIFSQFRKVKLNYHYHALRKP